MFTVTGTGWNAPTVGYCWYCVFVPRYASSTAGTATHTNNTRRRPKISAANANTPTAQLA